MSDEESPQRAGSPPAFAAAPPIAAAGDPALAPFDPNGPLPLAPGQVNAVAKRALLDGMHVSADARVALQKAATVAILMLGAVADEHRLSTAAPGSKRRKAVPARAALAATDIEAAMVGAGMAHLLPALRLRLGDTRRRAREGGDAVQGEDDDA